MFHLKSLSFSLFLTILCSSQVLAAQGKAVVRGTQEGSGISGKVFFKDTDAGLEVKAEFAGLAPGIHAFHIHEFGDCSDGGNAAGSHYNPQGAPHGLLSKDGAAHAHAGDMGNVEARDDGNAVAELILPGVTLNVGTVSVAGRGVIIHESEDDFGQPTGNAGGRIGCGEIVITS